METNFLDLEYVAKFAPSALADTHDGKRSDRYTFVPTRQIIANMESVGWGVSRALSPKARNLASRAHGKHVIAFRSKDGIGIDDPRGFGGKIYPEILILNSSNGTSRFEVHAGLFAFICGNGLVVSAGTFGDLSMIHAGFNPEDAYTLVSQFMGNMDKVVEHIERFQRVILTPTQQNNYALEASRIRWGDSGIVPTVLLNTQREEDKGDNLWTVYNKVQEHVMGGGFKLGKRKARPLTNIDRNLEINAALWELTERYANCITWQ